jgi:hypothetical protein
VSKIFNRSERRITSVYDRRNWKDGPAKPGAKKSAADRLPKACARAMNPPSTSIAAPVTHSDSSLARNNAGGRSDDAAPGHMQLARMRRNQGQHVSPGADRGTRINVKVVRNA